MVETMWWDYNRVMLENPTAGELLTLFANQKNKHAMFKITCEDSSTRENIDIQ